MKEEVEYRGQYLMKVNRYVLGYEGSQAVPVRPSFIYRFEERRKRVELEKEER
jgi:hypothetical protein